MAERLSRAQVLHIAELAKLALTEDEVTVFAEQLSEILDHADRLNALDTDAIPPTAHVLAPRNVMREDVPRPSLTSEQALANAPDRHDGFFRVKAVFD